MTGDMDPGSEIRLTRSQRIDVTGPVLFGRYR
jgi:hypothetical protein